MKSGDWLRIGQIGKFCGSPMIPMWHSENSKQIRLCKHINRINAEKLVRRITMWKPQIRQKGRPKRRWEEQVINNSKKGRRK